MDGNMHSNISPTSNKPRTELAEGASVSDLPATGEVEIAGRRYVTADRLAAMLGVTVRTLGRWDAARIGPPKIKVGKLVLFDIAKVPDWLATREIGPVRAAGRRR
jgi:DNA-binding transcriptional regulator YiaG